MKKETYVSLQKPKPFIASGSQTPITEEDIKKRKRKIERLEQIGERPTRVTEEEYENPYKLQAIALIEEDKDVPEELIKQIKEFEKTYLKEKPYKKETTKWN